MASIMVTRYYLNHEWTNLLKTLEQRTSSSRDACLIVNYKN